MLNTIANFIWGMPAISVRGLEVPMGMKLVRFYRRAHGGALLKRDLVVSEEGSK